MDSVSLYIKQTYQDLSVERTLKWGRIASLSCFLMILVFVTTDYTTIQGEYGVPFESVFPWRLMGLIPFFLFFVGGYTFLKTRFQWVIPMYSLCMLGAVLMISGIFYTVLSSYQDLKILAFGTTMGFITTLFVLSLIALGARRYLPFIVIALRSCPYWVARDERSSRCTQYCYGICCGIICNFSVTGT